MAQNLRLSISLLLNKALDLFFPKKCLGCNRPDTYLCRACFNKIELHPIKTKEVYLDIIISATDYRNPVIRELIKKFKYHYIKELAQPLSQLLIKSIALCGTLDFQHNAVIVPIALYKTRERSRGFNQAELLAKEIADYFNLSLQTNILKRTMPAEPQADIKDREKRKANIKKVFDINPEQSVKGKDIILIDDVTTTGATLSEAGKVLKNSGANQVWALVVARG